MRAAVSLSFQPSFASTRSGLPVTLRTASIVASSLSRPTFTLSTGKAAASRTFCRVISGVSIPIENVVTGAASGSSPSSR